MGGRSRMVVLVVVGVVVGLWGLSGCGPDVSTGGDQDTGVGGDAGDGGPEVDVYVPPCPDGVDEDGDGYGDGCAAGDDCDDTNRLINPGATEICNGLDDDCDGETDEDVLNACGNCSPSCTVFDLGNDPFPMPEEDDNADSDGVSLNPDGDLVLDQSQVNFNFLWIANSEDWSRGTVSKIDSQHAVEVARYFTVTCFGNPAYQQGQCLDTAGNAVQVSANYPSRTAVDFNFDVWVANRAFGGQASATKIANSLDDCIDRNGNGVIDTSSDQDGDGVITTDCNNDGQPDDITTVCGNGLPPEFLGYDDECVLFTTNYAPTNSVGRSMCLDAGDPYSGGLGNAWVGTYQYNGQPGGQNHFYKLDGATGQIADEVVLPGGVNVYGCAVDGAGILWATSLATHTITYFDTQDPNNHMGQVLSPSWAPSGAFYGIAIDSDQSVWLGGWSSNDVFRYRPDRTSFDTLGSGVWTRVQTHTQSPVSHTRGIAGDLRGWIWVASTNGYIIRLPQNIGDGDHTWSEAAGMGAMVLNRNLGDGMIGVGLDFDGHVWGMSFSASTATKIELDNAGDPVDINNNVAVVPVGYHPYTYSDFTGYGLRNFTRPRGTYSYVLEGCEEPLDTHWLRVEWNATTPAGTQVRLQVRTSEDGVTWGDWFGMWEISPAVLSDPPGPVVPDPARFIQVEFELRSDDREQTPILHDYEVVWDCSGNNPG